MIPSNIEPAYPLLDSTEYIVTPISLQPLTEHSHIHEFIDNYAYI